MRVSRKAFKIFLDGFGRMRFVHRYRRYNEVPEFLIISTGGVGTTMLMQHCSKYVRLNSPGDEDGLKHLPTIPVSFNNNIRILYIYGDLGDIYASLKRRGWVGKQGAKLGCPLCFLVPRSIQKRLFMNAANRQIECFTHGNGFRVFHLRYESIWDNKKNIAKFFGITESSYLDTFPSRKGRLGDQ